MGTALVQLGRYEEAREKLQQVLALAPGDARARAALEQVNQLLKGSS